MKWHFEKAEAGDFRRINELFTEMLQTIYCTDRVEAYADGALDRFFDGKEDWICTAIEDDKIIAFLSIEVHREDPDFLYLDDLSVTGRCRNRGIGTALIQRAEQYANELGISAIRLHVEKANEAATRLYERLGFSLREDQGNRILMEKNLEKQLTEKTL